MQLDVLTQESKVFWWVGRVIIEFWWGSCHWPNQFRVLKYANQFRVLKYANQLFHCSSMCKRTHILIGATIELADGVESRKSVIFVPKAKYEQHCNILDCLHILISNIWRSLLSFFYSSILFLPVTDWVCFVISEGSCPGMEDDDQTNFARNLEVSCILSVILQLL